MAACFGTNFDGEICFGPEAQVTETLAAGGTVYYCWTCALRYFLIDRKYNGTTRWNRLVECLSVVNGQVSGV